ncbi:tetratricopeptide repeat-containing sulfotransferase family protein [Sphingosinicella terrae]|uniref:tetratricopeptide repeat-containing sulfotransferase family protein n=1 Tax=Sphingosinicella terrae TaxID=2172047 RepID=UPI002546B430|nr:tetratricopeptide repeat-containing sulfotransferase family protein [Sphingosinicella terrae]
MSTVPVQPPEALLPALACLRRGDMAGARSAADAALSAEPDSRELLEFSGLLAIQAGDAAAAAGYFRRLNSISPADPAARLNLANALAAAGDLDEAGSLCEDAEGDPRLLRLLGYVRHRQDRLDEAIAAYDRAIAIDPADFEAWNNLGNVRAAAGDLSGAIAAVQKAIELRPDVPQMYLNLSDMLGRAELHESRQALMRTLAETAPPDPVLFTELGLAEVAARDFASGERAFREALRLDPRHTAAYLELGLLLDSLNRIDALESLVAEAGRRGLDGAEIGFIKAWALRRRGRFAEAQALADATPATVNPRRRAQLQAEIRDRLGDTDGAFRAYAEMNRAGAEATPPPPGPSYRESVAAEARMLTADWVASWNPADVDRNRPAPIFIIGFPRSGTTLLDTLLMNLPQLHVLEEMPVLRTVWAEVGEIERLAGLDGGEASRLRARYFEALEEVSPAQPGQIVVDKYPLSMARAPLIHRIFPDAKLVLCERHPCDAVLSCFMANFDLNYAMRSFVDLEEAARTYDAVFDHWTRARTLLPLAVHEVRYERLVEDAEAELRPLLDFLGLPWDAAVLDNEGAAARRDHIRTASYAQVTEPIYQRSVGRWQSYRQQMEPVLPLLAPWVERMGYEI